MSPLFTWSLIGSMQHLSLYSNRTHTSATPFHPRMELVGWTFHCNGHAIYLGRKPIASKIVRAFLSQKNRCLSKYDLITAVMNPSSPSIEDRTANFVWSKGQSLNRIMSRMRNDFTQSFQMVVPSGFHWFHYDAASDEWLLYKLPSEGANRKLYAWAIWGNRIKGFPVMTLYS